MFLHDVDYDKFDIGCGDPLTDPLHWDDEPSEAIVSNPPYSIKWEGDDNPLLINDPRFSPAGVLASKSKADLAFIKEIKDLIYRHQYSAMKQVNKELIELYWEIGEETCLKQKEQGWGKSVVQILSKELQKEFPGVQGYSTTNLWRMRSFYLEYSQNANLPPPVGEVDNENLQLSDAEKENENLTPSVRENKKPILPPLVGEISWSKHCVIIEKC